MGRARCSRGGTAGGRAAWGRAETTHPKSAAPRGAGLERRRPAGAAGKSRGARPEPSGQPENLPGTAGTGLRRRAWGSSGGTGGRSARPSRSGRRQLHGCVSQGRPGLGRTRITHEARELPRETLLRLWALPQGEPWPKVGLRSHFLPPLNSAWPAPGLQAPSLTAAASAPLRVTL